MPVSLCVPACLCSTQEPHENPTWSSTSLNQIQLPLPKENNLPPCLLSYFHTSYTQKPASANLRIMTVHSFFPSHESSNTFWVTSVAFPLTKIIAQQENKSFQIVSWRKHFGSLLYYNWKGKNLGFQTLLCSCHGKNDRAFISTMSITFASFYCFSNNNF